MAADSAPVLIFAPVGRDAVLTGDLLARGGIAGQVCVSIASVCAGIEAGAAALLLTEESIEHPEFERIAVTLRSQPTWSDIPVLLFAGSDGRTPSQLTVMALERLPNVTLLDRPIGVAVALSLVRSALRARARQFEVRDLLAALEDARQQAEAASRLKDEFLATLSHELRTPLNAILGWTAMLRHGQIDAPRAKRGLEVIDRNARAQAQLVEDVLDMARVITGNLRVDLKPLPLHGLVEAAVEALKPAADAKRVELALQAGHGPAIINADGGRLQQVMWNLLSNAVKFTPAGGRVLVRITAADAQVRVEVSDSGIGIGPEFLPFVFDRFRQADQSATRGHGGLGLGLAIVKHLVELHGGSVEVFSAGIGLGTTFTVVLPVAATISDRGGPSGAAETRGFEVRLPGRRVLVVDDDAATRELLGELFDRAEADVATAPSAAAAFALVRDEPPDVIIADIGLPGEDGCSLMRRIRALPLPAGAVPAIALSAYTRVEDREAARVAGFTRFIGKPAEPQHVLNAVDEVLRRSSGVDVVAGA